MGQEASSPAGSGRGSSEPVVSLQGLSAVDKTRLRTISSTFLAGTDAEFLGVEVPEAFEFEVTSDAAVALATQALKIDPSLQRLCSRIVPRTASEATFWRTYFWRLRGLLGSAAGFDDAAGAPGAAGPGAGAAGAAAAPARAPPTSSPAAAAAAIPVPGETPDSAVASASAASAGGGGAGVGRLQPRALHGATEPPPATGSGAGAPAAAAAAPAAVAPQVASDVAWRDASHTSAAPAAPGATATAPSGADPFALDGDDEDEVEQTLLTINESFVYRIPPRPSASGHRAADWDLAKPLFTTVVKVVVKGDALALQLWQKPDPAKAAKAAAAGPNAGLSLVAVCPIVLSEDTKRPDAHLEHFMEPVSDSSRYFVLRIRQGRTGKTAFLGLGFRERTMAFETRACIVDHLSYVQRHRRAAAGGEAGDEGGDHGLGGGGGGGGGELPPAEAGGGDGGGAGSGGLGPSLDLGLAPGATIRVSLKRGGPGKADKPDAGDKAKAGGAGTGSAAGAGAAVLQAGFLPAPPPPAPTSFHSASSGSHGGAPGLLRPPSGTATAAVAPAVPAAPGASGSVGTGAVASSGAPAAPAPRQANDGDGDDAGAEDDEWGDFEGAS